ncbi:MAG TPA: hypothetical protein VEH27_02460 [Methylomirabilota bacterium]|nr:hypothetical protein [Methylomirabilota bacterium]
MKSPKLILLKSQYDALKHDYANPARSDVIAAYHAELAACGRHYFDDQLEAYARDHGCLYGEETMLDMLQDGTLDPHRLAASVARHIDAIRKEDMEIRIADSPRG